MSQKSSCERNPDIDKTVFCYPLETRRDCLITTHRPIRSIPGLASSEASHLTPESESSRRTERKSDSLEIRGASDWPGRRLFGLVIHFERTYEGLIQALHLLGLRGGALRTCADRPKNVRT